jgi:hypothetical protein
MKKSRSFGMLILVIGLAAMTGCRRAPVTGGKEAIAGSLDAPARGSTMKEKGIVGGWAVADSGVKRVGIYMDRQLLQYTAPDVKREDIVKIFPKAGNSGWTVMVDVSRVADGNHEIVAKVESNQGNVREFGPVPFQVTH